MQTLTEGTRSLAQPWNIECHGDRPDRTEQLRYGLIAGHQ